MRPQKLIPEADVKLFEEAMKDAKTKEGFRRAQVLYLRGACKMSSPEIARVTGYGTSRVGVILGEYFKDGVEKIKPQGKGGRYRCLVSFETEKAFVEKYIKEASEGGILIVNELKRRFEEEMGLEISKAAFYALLGRHDWRKVAPRKRHPQQDPQAVEAFKKTLGKS